MDVMFTTNQPRHGDFYQTSHLHQKSSFLVSDSALLTPASYTVIRSLKV